MEMKRLLLITLAALSFSAHSADIWMGSLSEADMTGGEQPYTCGALNEEHRYLCPEISELY